MLQRSHNPTPPAGVSVPSLAWAQANCTVTHYDYGNGNTEDYYSCTQWGSGGSKFHCTWKRWGDGPLTLYNCEQIWTPHYHEVHGGSEGPQSYGTLPPYVPMSQRLQLRANGRNMTKRRIIIDGRRRINPFLSNPEGGGQTTVCPPGQEVCGDPTPGHGPPCCPIIVTPTPPTPVPLRRHPLQLRVRRGRWTQGLGRVRMR